jgi:hypothetical protein
MTDRLSPSHSQNETTLIPEELELTFTTLLRPVRDVHIKLLKHRSIETCQIIADDSEQKRTHYYMEKKNLRDELENACDKCAKSIFELTQKHGEKVIRAFKAYAEMALQIASFGGEKPTSITQTDEEGNPTLKGLFLKIQGLVANPPLAQRKDIADLANAAAAVA